MNNPTKTNMKTKTKVRNEAERHQVNADVPANLQRAFNTCVAMRGITKKDAAITAIQEWVNKTCKELGVTLPFERLLTPFIRDASHNGIVGTPKADGDGVVAHLVERRNGIAEVRGSIPLDSTPPDTELAVLQDALGLVPRDGGTVPSADSDNPIDAPDGPPSRRERRLCRTLFGCGCQKPSRGKNSRPQIATLHHQSQAIPLRLRGSAPQRNYRLRHR